MPTREASTALQRQRGNHVHPIPVRDTPVVLTTRGLLCFLEAIRTGEVVNAGLGAAQSADVVRSHVSARAIEAVCLLMVDSLDLETLMQVIPRRCLIGHAQPFPSRAKRA
jgi:hypothetical protein